MDLLHAPSEWVAHFDHAARPRPRALVLAVLHTGEGVGLDCLFKTLAADSTRNGTILVHITFLAVRVAFVAWLRHVREAHFTTPQTSAIYIAGIVSFPCLKSMQLRDLGGTITAMVDVCMQLASCNGIFHWKGDVSFVKMVAYALCALFPHRLDRVHSIFLTAEVFQMQTAGASSRGMLPLGLTVLLHCLIDYSTPSMMTFMCMDAVMVIADTAVRPHTPVPSALVARVNHFLQLALWAYLIYNQTADASSMFYMLVLYPYLVAQV